MLKISEIMAIFESEFSPLLGKFATYTLTLEEARILEDDHVWKPGVYVYWNKKYGAVKVGRSLTNARKRALEHIRDNTTGGRDNFQMKELDSDESTRLLLFVLKQPADIHWAAALEIFFEDKLSPYIPSGRRG